MMRRYPIKGQDISVVIPVFNRFAPLIKCVESVKNQTTEVGEIIVVDDGSEELFAGDIHEFCHASEISLHILSGNSGVSVARNLGIKKAKGSWIALLDSDDLWTEDKISSQIEFLNVHQNLRIAQSQETWMRQGKFIKPKAHHQKPSGDIWKQSLELCLVSPSAVIFEKELFDNYGPFDESMRSCEDYDLWLRIARHEPFGLVKKATVIKQGGHSDQLSAAYNRIDDFRIYSLIKNAISESSIDHKSALLEQALKKLSVIRNGAIKRCMPVSDLDQLKVWIENHNLQEAWNWLAKQIRSKHLRDRR